jgi:CHASE3 domain sensor protein
LAYLAHKGQRAHDLDSHWVLHTVQVKDQLEHLSALVKDVETSQRGYLLTQNPSFLSLYEKALEEIPGQIQSIAVLTSDNPTQVAATAHLRTLIADKLSTAAQSLSLAQQGNVSDAIQVVKTGEGPQLIDEIRAQVDAMMAEEDQLLALRESVFTTQVKIQSNFMTALAAVDVVLILGVTFFMLRMQQWRQKTDVRTQYANSRADQANTRTERAEARGELAIHASELRYRRLFETAQNGILILDADTGQVVDANPFMKDLLGYRVIEANLTPYLHFLRKRKKILQELQRPFCRGEMMRLSCWSMMKPQSLASPAKPCGTSANAESSNWHASEN